MAIYPRPNIIWDIWQCTGMYSFNLYFTKRAPHLTILSHLPNKLYRLIDPWQLPNNRPTANPTTKCCPTAGVQVWRGWGHHTRLCKWPLQASRASHQGACAMRPHNLPNLDRSFGKSMVDNTFSHRKLAPLGWLCMQSGVWRCDGGAVKAGSAVRHRFPPIYWIDPLA